MAKGVSTQVRQTLVENEAFQGTSGPTYACYPIDLPQEQEAD
jgi:hypothetical protein